MVGLVEAGKETIAAHHGPQFFQCGIDTLEISGRTESVLLLLDDINDVIDTGGSKQSAVLGDRDRPACKQRFLYGLGVFFLFQRLTKGIFTERIIRERISPLDIHFDPNVLFLVDRFPDHQVLEFMLYLVRFCFHQLADRFLDDLVVGDIDCEHPPFARG